MVTVSLQVATRRPLTKGKLMALINLDNSTTIMGAIKSIKLSGGIGDRYLETDATSEDITDAVLYVTWGSTRVVDAQNVIADVRALFAAEGRSLYSVQAILNSPEFKEAQIGASVEFAPQFAYNWQGVLVVKTTWQDDPDRNFS